ncbi:MAG: polysaccharide pyruvyl transferase family protein [Candidatus Bathyarchaeia archaeon]
MQKFSSLIAVVAPVSIKGLGDALQYYIALRSLKDLIPKDLTFFAKDATLFSLIFKDVLFPSVNCRFTNHEIVGYFFKQFLSFGTLSPTSMVEINNDNIGLLKCLMKNFLLSGINQLIIAPIRPLFSFDGCVIGGHTITERIKFYVEQYINLRYATKGPLITFPLSVSKLTLLQERSNIRVLRKALSKIDVIFTRGPYSSEILKEIGIEKDKIFVSPDSGFGTKIFFNYDKISRKSCQKGKGEKFNVLIIPEVSFFFNYGRKDLLPLYLKNFRKVVQLLVEKYEADIILGSTTLDYLDRFSYLCCPKGYESSINVFKPKSMEDLIRTIVNTSLIITGKYHGGIIGLCYGIPAIFSLPFDEVKTVDTLALLNLDKEMFLLDIFSFRDLKEFKLCQQVNKIMENHSVISRMISTKVKSFSPLTTLPARIFYKLLKDVCPSYG